MCLLRLCAVLLLEPALRLLPYLESAFQARGRVRPDPDRKGTRLDRVAHIRAPAAKSLRRHLEAHGAGFSGLQRDALKPFELFDRPRNTGKEVADVELDDLGTCPRAAVLDHDADYERAVYVDMLSSRSGRGSGPPTNGWPLASASRIWTMNAAIADGLNG